MKSQGAGSEAEVENFAQFDLRGPIVTGVCDTEATAAACPIVSLTGGTVGPSLKDVCLGSNISQFDPVYGPRHASPFGNMNCVLAGTSNVGDVGLSAGWAEMYPVGQDCGFLDWTSATSRPARTGSKGRSIRPIRPVIAPTWNRTTRTTSRGRPSRSAKQAARVRRRGRPTASSGPAGDGPAIASRFSDRRRVRAHDGPLLTARMVKSVTPCPVQVHVGIRVQRRQERVPLRRRWRMSQTFGRPRIDRVSKWTPTVVL